MGENGCFYIEILIKLHIISYFFIKFHCFHSIFGYFNLQESFNSGSDVMKNVFGNETNVYFFTFPQFDSFLYGFLDQILALFKLKFYVFSCIEITKLHKNPFGSTENMIMNGEKEENSTKVAVRKGKGWGEGKEGGKGKTTNSCRTELRNE